MPHDTLLDTEILYQYKHERPMLRHWVVAALLMIKLLDLSIVSAQGGTRRRMPWWRGIGDGNGCKGIKSSLLNGRLARLNQQCCQQNGQQHCSGGKPESCGLECANEFLAFWSDCRKSLPWKTQTDLFPVVNECLATERDGGNDHFAPPTPSPGPPPPLPLQTAAGKQGFSGFLGGTKNNPTGYSCADSKAVGLSDSKAWFYTWTKAASKGNKCSPAEQGGAEFVPMVNGVGQLNPARLQNVQFQRTVARWPKFGAKFLLGYNEPDDDGCGGCHRAPPAHIYIHRRIDAPQLCT